MAKHSPGGWHRHYLLSSRQCITTSDPDAYRNSGWQVVGESGPELINLRSGGRDGRLMLVGIFVVRVGPFDEGLCGSCKLKC